MKSYIINLATYDWNGSVIDYDYQTASMLWGECDDINAQLESYEITLTETANGSLILTAELIRSNQTISTRVERARVFREIERIADEYGGFELPARFLMGEVELNEIRSAV